MLAGGSLKSLSLCGAEPHPSSHASPAGAEKENKPGKIFINKLLGAVIRGFLLQSGCHTGGPSWQAHCSTLPSCPHLLWELLSPERVPSLLGAPRSAGVSHPPSWGGVSAGRAWDETP